MRAAEWVRAFAKDERGVETIEAVILMIAIVAIAFAFKNTLANWFNGLIGSLGHEVQEGVVQVNVGTYPE